MTDLPRPLQTPRVDAAPLAPAPAPSLPSSASTAVVRVLPTFTDIYAAEVRWVWRALWRLGVPDRDLEDVAHDVFVVVHRKLADYDPARPLRPWLFGICFRVALDRRRKASTNREQLGRADAAVGDDTAADIDDAVADCVAVLDAPLNTLYSRLRLARAAFARAVTRLAPGDESPR